MSAVVVGGGAWGTEERRGAGDAAHLEHAGGDAGSEAGTTRGRKGAGIVACALEWAVAVVAVAVVGWALVGGRAGSSGARRGGTREEKTGEEEQQAANKAVVVRGARDPGAVAAEEKKKRKELGTKARMAARAAAGVKGGKVPCWEMSKADLTSGKKVVFDYDELLEFAEGDIGKVFGPDFAVIDKYPRRVRLPAREYLLVTRVTLMDAEPHNFRVGARMVTEYDIPVNGELSEGGDVPWAVLVESGQCDLMLISYMGVDFQCKGDRVYRLLNTTLTFFGVAKEGETLVYDIRVTGFARRPNGEIHMFFFEYDCFCNGRLLIEMRNGCAGFFTDEELDAGKGVLHTVAELKARSKIVKQSITPFAIAPCERKTALSEAEMQLLVDRQWARVFPGAKGMATLNYKLCARKMLMIDRVVDINPRGGAHGLGLIIGEKILDPKHWYFPCHFVKDQVMAGSLVSDGCSQLLKLYMVWLGLHIEVGKFDFRPVNGHPNKVRCRGQISPHHGKLVYVMEIVKMGFDPKTGNPFAVANVDIIDVNEELGQTFDRAELNEYGLGKADKKIVVDFKGIALQMERREEPQRERVGSGASSASSTSTLSPPANCLRDDPLAPAKVTWHPMAHKDGNPTPSFSPSLYPPRAVCFEPFPGNPLDKDHTPGKMPLTWFNMSEFMCGKVSNCLGDEFARFDESKTSRSPAFDLALVTRVVSVADMEHVKYRNVDVNPSKGTMVGEFDCPREAWFFDGSCNDGHMPYSIVMEIGLQTSGVLTSVLKAPLTMDKDDILFRNLDATAEMVRDDVDVRGKTIKNLTRCTGYSMMGEMGIHRFTFELSVDGTVFYKGSTSFGWFVPEVFEKQVGLDGGATTQPWHVVNAVPASQIHTYEVSEARGLQALQAKVPAGGAMTRRSTQCGFLDKIEVVPSSGANGKGYAHGQKTVNTKDWFFSCHFWNDPVMPGSLGIESMFQLIEAFCLDTGLAQQFSIANPTFAHAAGKTSWKYRGQLTPRNKQMDSEVHIKQIEAQPDGSVVVVADGNLWVDSLRTYSADNLRVKIVPGTAPAKKLAASPKSSSSTTTLEQTPRPMAPVAPRAASGVRLSLQDLKDALLKLDRPLFLGQDPTGGDVQMFADINGGAASAIPPCTISDLGDKTFMEDYGVVAPLYTGAMAKGIASADLVIAAGKRKILGSFGAGGLPMHVVRKALDKILEELPNGPFAVNLIHSPFDSNLEEGNVDLFLEKGVRVVEASAFMDLTPQVVRYRAAGLSRNADGSIRVENRIIGKCSRTELAEKFIRPAPAKILEKLVALGKISADQAEMAKQVPMADDIAVEADSGGHTDNRPIHVILPMIINVRNRVQRELQYPKHLRVRVGAGGGIGCPQAALAAFNMGAAFLITGTVNQMSRQSGTCDNVRKALSKATYSDIAMAPAADMFDQGVELQVLKKGTMFPSRAKKLYELFCKYDSFEQMPAEELSRVEKRVFKKTLAQVWEETMAFYIDILKNPKKIEDAKTDGKLKMSLCFRWYLGLSSFWANNGIPDRVQDYQIWCGPAIGAFNDFIQGSYLDFEVSNVYPCVTQVNLQILRGAAFQQRLNMIRQDPRLDIDVDDPVFSYFPEHEL
ncbi:Polyketide biosynthesis protein PksE [Includes: Malonyl CoA-acyl carrier protein transacylase (MCT)] [Durusdinium trenchii]|uniref:Polyketide biosynthesis protein PksE n=1 Tax=Durusdinium trenchii TaxID=1381693 RepID=A0ABP0H7V8_9DINO